MQPIIEILNETEDEFLTADGFDDAILGVGSRVGQSSIVVYSRPKCIKILMDRDGMSHEDAEEFFNFNVSGAWMGDKTPLFIETFEDSYE